MIFLAIFFLGLQLGATACSISCMPILTPLLLLNSQSKTASLKLLYSFFISKVIAYTFISTIAFFGSILIQNITTNFNINKLLGLVMVLLGLIILYKLFFNTSTCKNNCSTKYSYKSYYLIGFLSSFNFCIPLISLITISSFSPSFMDSFLYGLFFGFGVVIIPFLFFYFFIFSIGSHIISIFYKYKKHIESLSAFVFILSGALIFGGFLKI